MTNLLQFGIQEAKKIAAENAVKYSELGDLDWHEARASVFVREIPSGLVGAGGFEVLDFEGHGFATRVYASGRIQKRGRVDGKMGWLPAEGEAA